jgi:hypothetical protein
MIRKILLLCALTAAVVGCDGGARTNSPLLSGRVTVDGKAAGELTLIVTAPDGSQSGGNTNAAGEYKIPNPPKGKLEFMFMAPARAAGPKIPAKYLKPRNGITVEYRGGDQVEDLKLTS